MHLIYNSQFFKLNKNSAIFQYIGYKYPESQWAGLLEEVHSCDIHSKETGYITLFIEAFVPAHKIENKLLAIAKIHGAHIVVIENVKSYKLGRMMFVYARCRRLEF